MALSVKFLKVLLGKIHIEVKMDQRQQHDGHVTFL